MNITKRFIAILLFGLISIGIILAQSFKEDLMIPSMAIYENYGLVYNIENEFYCFNNKTVRYFIDEHLGIMHLNPSGEINIKVNRDLTGNIINIIELTPEEYAIIEKTLDEIETKQVDLSEKRMQLLEMVERLNQNRNLLRPMPNNIPTDIVF
jgi:CO dehydrogenase/acetyl-CoA synthase beta subunit